MQSSPAGFCCLILKYIWTTKYHPTFEVRKQYENKGPKEITKSKDKN